MHKNTKHTLIEGLQEQGFTQLMKEATHIRGGNIDHVYWYDPDKLFEEIAVERYSPYYSDHDALLVTLELKVGYLLLFV